MQNINAPIWILASALPDGNTVRPISVLQTFTDEASARAAFDREMQEEWKHNAPCDDDGDALPYPGDPDAAHEAIVQDKAKGDVDEPWGQWTLTKHEVSLPPPPPAQSPDAMALLRELAVSFEENHARWARGDGYDTEDRACSENIIERVKAFIKATEG